MDKEKAARQLEAQENGDGGAFRVERTTDSAWYIANGFIGEHVRYLWPGDDESHRTHQSWPSEGEARARVDRYIKMLRDVAGRSTYPILRGESAPVHPRFCVIDTSAMRVERTSPDHWYVPAVGNTGHYLWPDGQLHRSIEFFSSQARAQKALDKFQADVKSAPVPGCSVSATECPLLDRRNCRVVVCPPT